MQTQYNKLVNFVVKFAQTSAKVWTTYTTLKHLQLHYSFKWPKVFGLSLSYIQACILWMPSNWVKGSIRSILGVSSKIHFHYNSYIIVLHIASVILHSLFWVLSLSPPPLSLLSTPLPNGSLFAFGHCAWNSFLLVYWEHVNTFFIEIIFRL